jgi:signal transduction histidine kinase/CheY-like chemotaxis protein
MISKSNDNRVLGDQMSALYRSGPILLGVNALNSAALAFFYGARVEALFLWPWLLAQAAFTLYRSLTLRAYFREEAKGGKTSPADWARRAFRANLFAGILWGAWVLTWREALPPAFFTIECVLVACVALMGLFPFLPGFYAFILPLTLAYAVSSYTHPQMPFQARGLGGIPFLILLSAFAHLLNRNLLATYRLRFENQDLVKSLTGAKARAEEALAAKTRFLAVASHDLRQPLQAQGLFLHALADVPAKGKAQRGILAKLQATHKALGSLLDGLLDLSLAESGTLKPRVQDFPLKPLFEKLKAEFAPLARRKGLAFSASLPSDWAQSDPELLGRMLRNLLSNALRYTPKGRVSLACRRRGKSLLLEVGDTGPGIPLAERQNVFKEFYQLRNPNRDRAKGLGLGLSIVRSLGSALDHPVGLVSTPPLKKGSLFTVRVPAAEKPRRAARDRKTRLPPFHGEAVLVLDDEKDIREGLAGLLKSWNLAPLTAGSMDGALRFLRPSRRLRALLCDYRLREGETGIEAIRMARRVLGEKLPAALVTGDTSPAILREARALGVPVLFKPVDPLKLRALLEGFLRGKQG